MIDKPTKCGFWRGHKWSNWEERRVDGFEQYVFGSKPIPFTRFYQRLACQDCGYMQQEEIKQ